MKKYQAIFIGRKIHAIGICYLIIDTVYAENRKSARLKLYEKYEHISSLTFKVI